MSKAAIILETLGIPYKAIGWEPKSPPKDAFCYAVIDGIEQDYGADGTVMARRVSEMVTLYDFGTPDGVAMRDALHDALSGANLKHTRSDTDYFKDEKVFMTEYDIEDYIEKRSF